MALDLSSSGVRLMQRRESGGWRELGVAPLDDDFSERIDALRVEALARGRGSVAIDIWLPPEILVRRNLPEGGGGHGEALRQLAAETGPRAHEMCVALAPVRHDGPVTVLAVPAQTVAEARHYVQRWGFLPGRVSIRPERAVAAAFGPDGPRCERPARFPRAVRGTRQAAVGAAALVLTGLVGWGAWALLHDPPPEAPATAPVLALPPVEAKAPGVDGSAFSQVRRRQVKALAMARPRGVEPMPAWRVLGPVAAPVLGQAPELSQPAAGVRMQVGPGPVRPDRLRPTGLDRVATDADHDDVAALVRSIGGLREKEAPPPVTGADGLRVTRAVAAKPAADAQPLAALPAVLRGGGPSGAAVESGAVLQLAAATAAPRSVAAAPPPKPDSAPEAESDTGSESEADGEAKAESGDGAEPASALAVLSAPRPTARPEGMAQRLARAETAGFEGTPAPGPIRNAAARRGLDLGRISLIGVLDAKSGRQALLRTPSGEFLKVGRGDTVEGWRVSAINRDAVRLTRGGQNRTLLLVQ